MNKSTVDNKEVVNLAVTEAYEMGFKRGVAAALDIAQMFINENCSDRKKFEALELFTKMRART